MLQTPTADVEDAARLQSRGQIRNSGVGHGSSEWQKHGN